MSYNDSYGGGRGDEREYGGGGRGGDNYYDQGNQFNDNQGGRGEFGGERQHGERQHGERHQGPGRFNDDNQGYGGNQGGYGGGGGNEEYGQRHQGGNRYNDDQGGYNAGGGGQGYGNDSYGASEGRTGGGRYGQGVGGGQYDENEAISHASQHAGSSGESGIFSQAMSFLGGQSHSSNNNDVDESQMVQAHQAVYGGQGSGQTHSADTLGAGAAMQALKMFSGGQSSSGGSQNEFIGMAMAQASKLFDQQGGNVQGGGDKQSVVNSAAKMAMQMYMKNQGGGSGGLMSLASKFM